MRRPAVAAALVALALLTACSPAAGPAVQGASRGGGTTSIGVGFSAPTPAGAANAAAAAGITPAYVSAYVGPGAPFPAAWAALAAKDGATLVIQLDTGSIPVPQVAAGKADGWLRTFARSAAQWRGPLAIGIDHEFNGPWWPWSYQHETAASFRAMWRHVVTLFRSEHVNASWTWTVSNVTGKSAAPLAPYWPGDSYVSVIGVNAYYYSAPDTFANTFAPVIARARALDPLPVLLTETGANPVSGRVRAIRDLFASVAADPDVAGFIWFDYDKQSADGSQHDWRIDNDPAALAAFRQAAREYR